MWHDSVHIRTPVDMENMRLLYQEGVHSRKLTMNLTRDPSKRTGSMLV